MFNSDNMPAYKIVFYGNDPQTGYYTKLAEQPGKTPVMRLPYQLKVEPTQLHEIKCNATQIIRGKETFKNGSFKFFTGLQLTSFIQWFAGNDYEHVLNDKILTICIFCFSANNNRLNVFYFSRFYIDKREAREKFINDVIPGLLKKYPLV